MHYYIYEYGYMFEKQFNSDDIYIFVSSRYVYDYRWGLDW
jgi:hypothetical protein